MGEKVKSQNVPKWKAGLQLSVKRMFARNPKHHYSSQNQSNNIVFSSLDCRAHQFHFKFYVSYKIVANCQIIQANFTRVKAISLVRSAGTLPFLLVDVWLHELRKSLSTTRKTFRDKFNRNAPPAICYLDGRRFTPVNRLWPEPKKRKQLVVPSSEAAQSDSSRSAEKQPQCWP